MQVPFKDEDVAPQATRRTIFELVAQLAVQGPLKAKAVGSLPTEFTKFAGVA